MSPPTCVYEFENSVVVSKIEAVGIFCNHGFEIENVVCIFVKDFGESKAWNFCTLNIFITKLKVSYHLKQSPKSECCLFSEMETYF